MAILKVRKAKVALKLSSMNVLEMIQFSKHVIVSMTGNAYFPSPSPSLALISSNTADLEAAHNAVRKGWTATTEDKLTKRKTLHNALTQLGAYVEGTANLDPQNAVAIIQSSGMEVKSDAPPKPAGFRLQLTGLPGQVKLMTTRVRYAVYKWQYTTTPNDVASWLTYFENNNRQIVVSNLVSGQRYYFRVAVVKHGVGPWSVVLDTIVL